jgi:hypothetical protein
MVRKTVGHPFMKPVQMEGTTQTFFSQKVVSHCSSHFCCQAVWVYVVRKWPLQGRSHFVCWNITRVSLWLLCNVHFMQSTQMIIVMWPRWPKGTDHYSSEEYRCTHVAVHVARTWISYRCVLCHLWCTRQTSLVVKKNFSFSVAVNNFIKVGPLVFLL